MEHSDNSSTNMVSINEEREPAVYLMPTFTIESDHERIVETAREITRGCRTDEEKAIRVFYFVRDMIYYNVDMVSVFEEDFRATRILEWRQGYCVQKAVLLTALGRASSIPTRLTFAKIKNHKVPPHILQRYGTNIFPRHGYNQFFLNGRWISAAATFNKSLCEKINSPTTDFDGENDSVLPSRDREGKPYIEYIEKFGHSEDLPFQWIRDEVVQMVGVDKRSVPMDTPKRT
ncbi:MAG: transglutaminase family protein [Deltaproteobacteria bacterium]